MSANLSDVSGKIFDYVVVGGGVTFQHVTAGLALASRLSEDPSVTVVVIEAGEANIGDPNILVPAQFGRTFKNSKYDWAFMTEKQKFSNNNEFMWSRGKGLGGTSGLNFYAWIKPPATDIDAIEKLGNPGWNWKEYLKYSQRSETFHPPREEQMNLYPHTYESSFHGTSGPIHTTIPFHFHALDSLFQQTLVNKGLKSIKDPYGGDINGTWIANSTLDPSTWTRSYAATGYFLPVQERPNLTVLTDATVTRIVFNDPIPGQNLTATGVEFVHSAHTCHVNAKCEVILSAGKQVISNVFRAIQNPKILELSGVGRAEVLGHLGVDVKIELDGVGENVQEHTFMGVSYELAGSPETWDRMREPAYAAEAMKLHAEGRGPQRIGITSFAYFSLSAATPEAPALIDRAAEGLHANEMLPPGLQEQLDLQLACLRDDSAPDLELIGFPSLFTTQIHRMNLEILVQHFKYIRTMAQTEPMKSGVVREVDPGPACVTDEDIREYIKNTLVSTWHTIASCSMLPREKNGVVDPDLKVSGEIRGVRSTVLTKRDRIVDISILPLHIAAHTQATAYMIAEKAFPYLDP
ncbi:GMC oxidoreductase [Mycena epipterygia]|nr:GMC oxidoreductase [Mycena epipterygia]